MQNQRATDFDFIGFQLFTNVFSYKSIIQTTLESST